jgi:hypothetical protein
MLPEAMTRQHALVTTQRASPYVEACWRAILKLAKTKGSFTYREVMKEAALGEDARGGVVGFLTGLNKAGHLDYVARPPTPGVYTLIGDVRPEAPRVTQAGTQIALGGQFTVVIPRTEDGVWTAIRELGRTGGEFTVSEIVASIKGAVSRETVADYLRRLSKGGYVKPTSIAKDRQQVWCLMRAPAETPRLAFDGSPLKHATLQDVIWRALDMNNTAFLSAEELSAAIHGNDLACDPSDVRDYCEHLTVSGHVIRRAHSQHAWAYRLLRYTGPMAPRILSAQFVWDPNKNCVFGEGQRVREVRR